MNKTKASAKQDQKNPMNRRDFMRQGATAVGIGVAATYLSCAPEDYPFSLRDTTGLRSQPQPDKFRLPDYRIAAPSGKAEIGVGRGSNVGLALRKALEATGGITHFIKPNDIVLIKPNAAFDRSPNLGATTHPDIIAELIRIILTDCRAREVRVADNPIESPADCFAKTGIRQATERAGGKVFLPDGNAFKVLNTPGATLIENWLFFYRPLRNVNKVIGLSPVKDHNLCQASLGLKNWYGLLGGRRNQFHQDIHEVVSDLGIMIKPTLTILDGTHILMKNGPTGGNPSSVKKGNAVVAGTDPVAIDAWAFEHLLERKEPLPQYLIKAEQKGVGKIDASGRLQEVT